jgi:murein DD-endopeptidase MepM/ murein hydrolase activator NlpD
MLTNSFSKASNFEKQIDELTKQNNELKITNEELVEKNSILSDTIVQKVEVEEALEAQEAQKYVPNGIPVSRALSITEVGTDQTEEVTEEDEITEETVDAQVTEEDATQIQGQVTLVEFLVKSASEVMATANGTILYVGDDDEYTKVIKIDHGNGYISISRYANNARVNEGDEVLKGDILFELNTSNEKLGYQILYNEEYVDPMELMEIYG